MCSSAPGVQHEQKPPSMSNPWKSGLCSCCTLPGGTEACFLGLCCTSVLYGLAVEKLARPHECVVGGTFVGAFLVHASCGLCATCVARGAFREKYGIEGNCCTDCLIAYFCDCCAVIQVKFIHFGFLSASHHRCFRCTTIFTQCRQVHHITFQLVSWPRILCTIL
mmetsp:Transcript_76060/g.204083  ORF Transcript_76060/g.204083 Transcript_76060/m.204083 type:complete len:165 (+) Transcript_76060:39-533(+)